MLYRLPAAALLLVCFALPSPAQADPPVLAQPLALYVDAGDHVIAEEVAVARRIVSNPNVDRYFLMLKMIEIRLDGIEVPLAAQTVWVTDTTLLTLDGPGKSAVLVVEWSGVRALEASSDVLACVQLFRMLSNGEIQVVDDMRCQVLNPLPF